MKRRRLSIRLMLLNALTVAVAGCTTKPSTAPSNLPVVPMQIGSTTYQLEVAANEDTREHGLMERDTLPRDHGMIFVFDQPAEQSFWMHHTRFPLDILFIDNQNKVVSIHTMKAYDENNTPSNGVSKYAIELNAGETAADGVKTGEVLRIPREVDIALGKK